uniref:Uncharacterized protein n=1 Tax=viral metagenome TaxID=1070528 RepID=A0A6M3JLX3_9ZZZZ
MKFRITKFMSYGMNVEGEHYETYFEASAALRKIKKDRLKYFIEMSCDGEEWFALA